MTYREKYMVKGDKRIKLLKENIRGRIFIYLFLNNIL